MRTLMKPTLAIVRPSLVIAAVEEASFLLVLPCAARLVQTDGITRAL